MSQLPDPTPAAAQLWLKRIDRTHLHNQGWVQVNKRFHGLARAARAFINEQYPDDPEQQEAAFDGFTLALLAAGHFSDLADVAKLFNKETPPAPRHAGKRAKSAIQRKNPLGPANRAEA